MCENIRGYGNHFTSVEAPHLLGGWAEHIYVRPDAFVYRVPDGIDAELAVMTELMAVTYNLDKAKSFYSMDGEEFGAPSMLRINYSHVRTAPLVEHLAFMSIHALDLARFFLGDVADGSVHLAERGGQHVVALTLEHASGCVSMLSLSALEPRLQETVELAGESTLIRVRDLGELVIERAAPEWEDCYQTDQSMAMSWRPDFTIPTDDNNSLVLQGYAGEMIELASAIREGLPVTGNIHDALAAMRLVDAIGRAPLGFSRLDLG